MQDLVYDCFTFFNELDLLEIRLNILSDVVDKFVLVEADRTFTNKEKPFYFEENKERYKRFLDKIIHIKTTDYSFEIPMNNTYYQPVIKNIAPVPQKEYEAGWNMEFYQRNQIAKGLTNCTQNDVILISDLDEIPNPEIITHYKEDGNGIYKLKQVPFYYYLNYQECITKYWYGTRILRYKEIISNKFTPQKIRMENDVKIIKKGGWHFSYLGGMDAIKYKIQSFAHQEYNNEKYLNDEIENKIRLGLDIFGRNSRFIPIAITTKTHPAYIINNMDKYKHLIYPKINQYIVIKNTAYYLVMQFPGLIIRIIKKILPKSIVNKLKAVKRHLRERKNGT